MTPEEKTLLLAVAGGLYNLLKERLIKNGVEFNEAETFGPFKALINAVKDGPVARVD